jgi:4-hydroxy-tetrahydrodipicolinate synthase
MAVGAQGVVSVASNVAPRAVGQMVDAFASGRLAAARKLHARYYPLFKDLFVETNPAPVKAALAMMGLINEELRLPLVPLSDSLRPVLKNTLKGCGVLK